MEKLVEPLCVGRNKVSEARSKAYGFFPCARLFRGEKEYRVGDTIEQNGQIWYINQINADHFSVAEPGFLSTPVEGNLDAFGLTLVKTK